MFSKELRCMLYGYGDDKNPYTETVDFLEDLVMEFISEMTHKSMEIGRQGRVQVDIGSGFMGKPEGLYLVAGGRHHLSSEKTAKDVCEGAGVAHDE